MTSEERHARRRTEWQKIRQNKAAFFYRNAVGYALLLTLVTYGTPWAFGNGSVEDFSWLKALLSFGVSLVVGVVIAWILWTVNERRFGP